MPVLLLLLCFGLPAAPAQAVTGTSQLERFSGRGDRAGNVERGGSLTWKARFTAEKPRWLDLSSGVQVFIDAGLAEPGGESLLTIDGINLTTTALQARPGARDDRAIFSIPGRNSSGARVTVRWSEDDLRVELKVGRALIAPPAACLAGETEAALTTTVVLDAPGVGREEIRASRTWQCSALRQCDDACWNLRARWRSQGDSSGGSSGDGGRPPSANLRFENLTRDRDALNWIRLDARGSESRDGEIIRYRYLIRGRASQERILSPGATTTPVAYVLLSPGDYEATVTVTDDQGRRDTETRRLSVAGNSIESFDRLGVEWALDPDWAPGDEALVLHDVHGPIDLAAIAENFFPPPPSQSRVRSDQTATSSDAACPSPKTPSGIFNGKVFQGIVNMTAIGLTLAFGPEAGLALKFTDQATVVGTNVASNGGSAASTCTQNEIDALGAAIEFEAKQIAQLQNQLIRTDAAFFQAWEEVLNVNDENYHQYYMEQIEAFSGTPASTCSAATPDGPASNCTLTEGGTVGGFLQSAGVWCESSGTPVPELCNVPLEATDGSSCDRIYDCSLSSGQSGPFLLQNIENFQTLQTKATSLTGDFPTKVQNLTGTTLSTDCVEDVSLCATYETDVLFTQMLEALQKTLLAQAQTPPGGSVPSTLAAKQNVLPLIDSYNQTLAMYVHSAIQVLGQAFQMEWLVNNFNFFGNLPAGPVNNYPVTSPTIANLGAEDATYFAGPSEFVCSGTSTTCFTDSSAYACANQSYLGIPCDPGDAAACGANQTACTYEYCDGDSASCTVDTSKMAQAYNAAQLELAYAYAARINLVYKLGLRYLVTDLPVGDQLWPGGGGEGRCLPAARSISAGLCEDDACAPTPCASDTDCPSTNPRCVVSSVDWSGLVTSSAYCEIGTACGPGAMTRLPPYITQPKGWIANENPNFEASPYQSTSPYQAGSSCAANYQTVGSDGLRETVVGDPVSGGQPGTVGSADRICPSEFPYCVGYLYGRSFGQCSDVAPWTDSAILYQYALNDPYQCRKNIDTYNADWQPLAAGDKPNLAGAWPGNAECPSVFQTPGGQAPRYGYFDGLSLQGYTFGVDAVASGCPDECSADLCGSAPGNLTQTDLQCTTLERASATNGAPASFEGESWSDICTTVVSTVDTGAESQCLAFCALNGEDSSGTSPPYTCVDAGYAQQNLQTKLVNCQGCAANATRPVLSLMATMQGNLGACANPDTSGMPLSGPKMGLYTPEDFQTVSFDPKNPALLCAGCVYLGCGNYEALDPSKAFEIIEVPSGQTNAPAYTDAIATTYFNDGACPDGQACTVAWLQQSGCETIPEWFNKDSQVMSTVMINDYRCALGGGGSGIQQIGITNESGDWSGNLNADAVDGVVYPWGCGAIGFSTQTYAGADGYTEFANLVFEQPNVLTGLWDPVADSSTRLGYNSTGYDRSDNSGYSGSGPQMGVQLAAQCSFNCGNAPTSAYSSICLSAVTTATPYSMDTQGYACEADRDRSLLVKQSAMDCTMNDGRTYRIAASPRVGGLPGDLFSHGSAAFEMQLAPPPDRENLISACVDGCSTFVSCKDCFQSCGPQCSGDAESAECYECLQDLLAQTWADCEAACSCESECLLPPSTSCPAACLGPHALSGEGGETFGGLALESISGPGGTNADGCPAFVSGFGYCGGYCYNQPVYASDRTPGRAAVDCRGCQGVRYEDCPSGWPYQGDDVAGGYCCESDAISAYKGFPYSTQTYGDFVIDHCPGTYTPCPDPPCGIGGKRIPSAAANDSCYPYGNTAMYPLWPFTY